MRRRTKRDLALDAFDEAAHVLQRAKLFFTPIALWQDGKVLKIPSENLELRPVVKNGRKTVELVDRTTGLPVQKPRES